MLEEQAWIRLSQDMEVEWQQAMDEGRAVEDFRTICETIQKNQGSLQYEELASAVRRQMDTAPQREDFPFDEPSALEEIRAARPAMRHTISGALPEETLRNAVRGAWLGRIAGCLLGKPVECWHTPELHALLKKTGNYPLHRYIESKDFTPELIEEFKLNVDNCWADRVHGRAPIDDDTNYTVLGLKLVETYGVNFRPNDVLEAWLFWLPYFAVCTAERVAYRNAAMGLRAPQTATENNPYREWIGAQIRADFFGYLNVGNPRAAAEMAWRDASISHVKNGIYGEMWVAAMLAAAPYCSDPAQLIEIGLDELPQKCRLREKVEQVLAWYRAGQDADAIMAGIHAAFNEFTGHGWCHTIANAMIVAMGLLCGAGDFGKAICLVVQCGFDTDCNGATVGSIKGMMHGAQAIPAVWTAPFSEGLSTSIPGNDCVDIDELVERTLAAIAKLSE